MKCLCERVPRDAPLDQYRNLVFSGAAIRGVGYGGFWRAWERLGRAEAVRHVAGSSCGALFALAVVLGFTGREIKRYAITTEWSRVFGTTDNCFLFKFLLGLSTVRGRWGCLPMDGIRCLIEWMCVYKGFPPHMTMGEFYQLQAERHRLAPDEHPAPRHLYVNAVDIRRGVLVDFSTHDPLAADTRVSDCILHSMCIPGVFQPVCGDVKSDPLYLDAGLISSSNCHPFMHDIPHTLVVRIVDCIPQLKPELTSCWDMFCNSFLALHARMHVRDSEFPLIIFAVNNCSLFDCPTREKQRLYEIVYEMTRRQFRSTT